jgi:hypothetical protein
MSSVVTQTAIGAMLLANACVADWWLEQTGQRVSELEPNAVVGQHKPAQKTLFDMEGE